MFKLFLGLLIITTFLNADVNEKSCQRDLDNMISYYYVAERAYNDKNYSEAMSNFQKSSDASYLALESCEKISWYDYRVVYNYIVECESKQHQIYQDIIN